MNRSPHLLLAISAHGYGHLAQCAPVIAALAERVPDLRLTVMSRLPEAVLRERIAVDFDCLAVETDPVLRMHSAWEVDVQASCDAYRAYHADHHEHLSSLSVQLRALQPDLVLANIPWPVLVAAQRVGIPAIALCSLNWAAVFEAYCRECPDAAELAEEIRAGYRAADTFLLPAPALDMPELGNTRAIGPIARSGTRDHTALCNRLGLPEGRFAVLVALGGIPSALPLEHWPEVDGIAWLFPEGLHSTRDDMIDCGGLSMRFIDLLASCDTILTKPGYGTCVEAVCNGVPLLMLERSDWPETAGMIAWAKRHGCLEEISQPDFCAGRFVDAVSVLRMQPAKIPPFASGSRQAAEVVAEYLTIKY